MKAEQSCGTDTSLIAYQTTKKPGERSGEPEKRAF
jgi:hypothetical protein